MKKFIILAAAIVLQTALGGIYAWSAFTPALMATHHLSTAQTQWIFGLAIATLTLTMILAGGMLERWGPRLTAGLGGLLFGGGYYLASASQGNFILLALGIGLIAGAGTGFGYICPLAVAVKWFPNHRGLVTGLAVAGFGGGGALLSTVADRLLMKGLDVLAVFRVVALSYGPVILLAALVLGFPTSFGQPGGKIRMQIADLFVRGDFWQLAAGMFAGTFAGLLVIGNLKPLGLDAGVSAAAATAAVGLFALGNAAGRICWGAAYDRWHDKMLPLGLAFITAAVLMLLLPPGDALFMVTSFLIGFGFGSCFVLYAARVATVYGVDSVAGIYPFIFLFYGFAGIIGPVAGGMLYDLTQSFFAAILTSAVIAALGTVFIFPMAINRPD